MPVYTIKQGDHLSAIAKKFGFRNYKTIWDDPGNADLQNLRLNPNVLLPGDQLVIPGLTSKTESAGTGDTHKFVVPVPKLELRILTHDINDDPVASESCTLQVESEIFQLQTDGDGLLQQKIAADAVNGLLQVVQMDIPLKIGFLDPSGTPSGSRARLTNLGYYWGPQDESDTLALKSAIEEFQCDHTLPVTGNLDKQTQTRLLKEHGC